MLEANAGKLRWEPIDQGIRVELPAPLDWPHVRWAIVFGAFMALWVYFVMALLDYFEHAHLGLAHKKIFLFFVPLYVAGQIWNLRERRTILTLTPNEMTLARGVRETRRNTRVFANTRLQNLGYRVSHYVRTAEHELVKDSIICDVEGRTIAIMSGISKEEGEALIEKMMAIYKFPNTIRADNLGR